MALALKPLNQQVIVITGASSGIGLATARMAAHRGARVVLAARNESALKDIVRDIKRQGGNAIAVRADVSSEKDIAKLADAAIRAYGRIDTWVNNAGLGIWGKIEDGSLKDYRTLFDINFWGIVHGTLEASKRLRRNLDKNGNGVGGAIINLGSEVSDHAPPLQGIYSASKHAVKGFTDAFRIELEQARTPIAVTLIKPAAIGTPFAEHARNYTKKEARLPAPVYAPEEVASAILHAAISPTRDIYVGGASKAASLLNRFAPDIMDWVGGSLMSKAEQSEQPVRHRSGSLDHFSDDGKTRGAATNVGTLLMPSLYTRAATHKLATSLIVAAASAGAAALFGSHQTRQS